MKSSSTNPLVIILISSIAEKEIWRSGKTNLQQFLQPPPRCIYVAVFTCLRALLESMSLTFETKTQLGGVIRTISNVCDGDLFAEIVDDFSP